jgi:hypothetical protein
MHWLHWFGRCLGSQGKYWLGQIFITMMYCIGSIGTIAGLAGFIGGHSVGALLGTALSLGILALARRLQQRLHSGN